MKILVIAPHGDDEALGAGGVLAKHARAGDTLYRCIVTKTYPPEWPTSFQKEREREIARSGEILHITKTFSLGFPTVKLDTVPQKELNDRLSEIVKEVRPDIVYTTSGADLNRDHRIVFESTLVAARPVPGSSVKKLLSYEVVSETEWGRNLGIFNPNYYVPLTAEDVRTKLSAMKAYKSELREYPHPRSLEVLETLAKLRGSEIGCQLAEAFALIREIKL